MWRANKRQISKRIVRRCKTRSLNSRVCLLSPRTPKYCRNYASSRSNLASSQDAQFLRKRLTLVFVEKEDTQEQKASHMVLLGMKKRGFGEGKWNGFGGKVEAKETIEQGARRELEEECGLSAEKLSQRALILFEFENDPTFMEVHVFFTTNFSGDPIETDEMRPKWYRHSDIPFSDMWADDDIWLPRALDKEPLVGYFLFRGMTTVLQHHLESFESNNFPSEQTDEIPSPDAEREMLGPAYAVLDAIVETQRPASANATPLVGRYSQLPEWVRTT